MTELTELTDRMRTCAAYLLARTNEGEQWAVEIVAMDAADLLVEASNLLCKEPAELGEPMAILPVVGAREPAADDLWIAPGGALPGIKHSGTVSPRVCPACDSRATKKVFRDGRRLMLECPACSQRWRWAA